MLTSLALIFLAGLAAAWICQRTGLPRIIGMLAAGILLGPYALHVLDSSILSISASLRQAALVVILLKAGLSLNLAELKQVGRPALLMSFVPASFEILGYVLLAPYILGITPMEGAVMGAVLAAVSPTVVVPRMVQLIEQQRGTRHGIPQMIMAGASCDDVFVLVLFTAFTSMAQGGSVRFTDLMGIPVSILLGIALGAAVGICLGLALRGLARRGRSVGSSVGTLVILSIAFLLAAAEQWLTGTIPVSGLLAVISMASALKTRYTPAAVRRLSDKLGKLWLAAEIVLFVLVGAAVDIRYTLQAGLAAGAMILTALLFRSAGVALCLIRTGLSRKERLFCLIAYLPKATVQAAIGSAPLAMGLSCGRLVLSVAVLGILITAPLGAIGIDRSHRRLLDQEPPAQP